MRSKLEGGRYFNAILMIAAQLKGGSIAADHHKRTGKYQARLWKNRGVHYLLCLLFGKREEIYNGSKGLADQSGVL